MMMMMMMMMMVMMVMMVSWHTTHQEGFAGPVICPPPYLTHTHHHLTPTRTQSGARAPTYIHGLTPPPVRSLRYTRTQVHARAPPPPPFLYMPPPLHVHAPPPLRSLRYPPELDRCLNKLSRMSPDSIMATYGFPDNRSAHALFSRATGVEGGAKGMGEGTRASHGQQVGRGGGGGGKGRGHTLFTRTACGVAGRGRDGGRNTG